MNTQPVDQEDAWLRYHYLTEKFDRSLPGHWFRPGEWMPAPGEPAARSREYARSLRKDLRLDNDSEWKSYFAGMSYEKLAEMAGKVEGAEE